MRESSGVVGLFSPVQASRVQSDTGPHAATSAASMRTDTLRYSRSNAFPMAIYTVLLYWVIYRVIGDVISPLVYSGGWRGSRV